MTNYLWSIRFLISHSWVTVISILLLQALSVGMKWQYVKNGEPYHLTESLLYIPDIMVGIMSGLYLANSFLLLSQHHFWHTNIKFRKSLILGLLSTFLISSLTTTVPLIFAGYFPWLSLALLFSINLFTSFVLIAKRTNHRILLPLIPFIALLLFQQFPEHRPLVGLVIFIMIIISLLVIKSAIQLLIPKQLLADSQPVLQESRSILTIIAEELEKPVYSIAEARINKRVKQFDWLIFSPATQLGASTALFVSLMFIAASVKINSIDIRLSTMFIALIFTISNIALLLEISQHMKSCKIVAHLFKGNSHESFKQELLTTLNRVALICNGILLIIWSLLFSLFDRTEIIIPAALSLVFVQFFTYYLFPLVLSVKNHLIKLLLFWPYVAMLFFIPFTEVKELNLSSNFGDWLILLVMAAVLFLSGKIAKQLWLKQPLERMLSS